ncbi:hypothetical protein ElyMa_005669400 [Elysia marginata]|uniref:Uncharacterized protein n=1 Tax=Elysia marginata TaxID=1093978 RepID=A0AAV4FFC0_9GAST|nr:hypothetical protein ElyMa_005669400 [Elysia marginata]
MSRGEKREGTSATTTIGRASIIDWTDNSSETARERAPLSGELSFLLPPVTRGQQELMNQPAPGLDTTDLLHYRPNNARASPNRSPQPRSRAGHRHLPRGFRPPQNTPSRPEDFSASLRKSVNPRRVTGVSGVVVLGGGIKPPIEERWSNHREQIVLRQSRNSSYLSPREVEPLTDRSSHFRKHRGKQLLYRSLGRPNFELPMIDLKCVESPVGGLGNLEEKGIRLVRLRRVKRASKRKAPGRQDSDPATDQSQRGDDDGDAEDDKISNGEEEFDKITKISEKESIQFSAANAVKTAGEKKEMKTFTPRSTTSSASSIARELRDAEEESLIGTNREPYLTPLLPNLTPQDTARTVLTTPTARQAPPSGAAQLLPPVFTVEQATPTHLNVDLVNPDGEENADYSDGDNDDIEVYSGSVPPATGGRRKIRRSSSLLSVPTSDTSELRPRMDTQRTVEENPDLVIAVSEAENTPDDLTNRTIATQTGARE